MFEGGILKAGIPRELVEDEMVRRVYLGQNFEIEKKRLNFRKVVRVFSLKKSDQYSTFYSFHSH
jgi:hypothetical protein